MSGPGAGVEGVACDPSEEAEALVAFLSGERWPFHGSAAPDAARVRGWLEEGRFDPPAARPFWLWHGGERVGLLVVQELDDPTPVFDLRLEARWRGRGLGRAALRWLARWVFTATDKRRVEGHTRADNLAMRGCFAACGWVQEGYHRQVWPDDEGRHHDAAGYALLREDWARGRATPLPPGEPRRG